MKFVSQTTFTIILVFILSQFMPFWNICIAALFVAFFSSNSTIKSFFAGFIATFSLWGISAWIMSDMNDNILLERVAGVFTLTPWLMLLLGATIGGLLGGLGAMTGTTLRKTIYPFPRESSAY